MAGFLFVQNAKGITYADGKLTLNGVSPARVAMCGGVRPPAEINRL